MKNRAWASAIGRAGPEFERAGLGVPYGVRQGIRRDDDAGDGADHGQSLPGDLSIPPDPRGIVLFAHGSGSSRHSSRNQYVARTLEHRNLATLLIDLLTPDEEVIDDTDCGVPVRHSDARRPACHDCRLAAAPQGDGVVADWPVRRQHRWRRRADCTDFRRGVQEDSQLSQFPKGITLNPTPQRSRQKFRCRKVVALRRTAIRPRPHPVRVNRTGPFVVRSATDNSVHGFRKCGHTKSQDRRGAVRRFNLERGIRPVVGALDVDAGDVVNDVREVLTR